MSDQEFVIELEDETEGHRYHRGIVEPEDAGWLEDRIRHEGGKTTVRLLPNSDDEDTEGHGAAGTILRLSLEDDDDTEGHAIAIHFPSRAEADAFRRRLMVTGVLAGTVALGAAGGIGLANLQSDAGTTGAAGSAVTQVGPMDAHEAPAFTSQARADQAYADRLSGLAAANEASTSLSAADQAYADRLSGQAAATQVGPLDAHEAPAFGSEAAAQVGPLDAHEAPAFGSEAAAQVGPLDAHEAPAFQSTGTDDGDEVRTTGGPTPR